MHLFRVALTLIPLFLVASSASAAINIDMEGFAPTGGLSNENSSTRTFGDKFLFTVHGHYVDSAATGYASNGTDWLLNDNNLGITITEQSGGLFSANRFDASEWSSSYQNNPSYSHVIVVTGTFADNSTTVQTFTTDSVFGFQTFTLNSSFQNLKSLQFVNNNPSLGYGIMGFDNIILDDTSAVPEPASLAIWGGISLVGLVAARRRKKILS